MSGNTERRFDKRIAIVSTAAAVISAVGALFTVWFGFSNDIGSPSSSAAIATPPSVNKGNNIPSLNSKSLRDLDSPSNGRPNTPSSTNNNDDYYGPTQVSDSLDSIATRIRHDDKRVIHAQVMYQLYNLNPEAFDSTDEHYKVRVGMYLKIPTLTELLAVNAYTAVNFALK